MKSRVVLRDRREVIVREVTLDDKEGLVNFYAGLSHESLRWGLPPYDRQRIERWIANSSNGIVLVAEHDRKIVGNLNIFTPQFDRLKGNGELLIYLHQDFQKVGLGTEMITLSIEEARRRGMHRLGLTVVADNHVGIRVYEKVGFKREGLRKEVFLGDDGRFHDEVEMGLLL